MFLITQSNVYALLLLLLLPYYSVLTSVIISTLSSSRFLQTTVRTINRPQVVVFALIPFSLLVIFITSPLSTTSILFGHIFITQTSTNFVIIATLMSLSMLWTLRQWILRTSDNYSDLLTLLIFFNLLTSFLFFVYTLLGIVFLLESLTTIIFILVILWNDSYKGITATFQTSIAQIKTPFDALFFFFWSSFLIAIALFYSISLLLSQLGSSDWVFLEFLMATLLVGSKVFVWSNILLLNALLVFLFALFCKFALSPFFFWKPVFFRYLSPIALLFYIVFFYSVVFSWFAFLWCSLSPIITSIIFSETALLFLIGLPALFPLLSSFDRLQNFVAVSSIFNTSLLWFSLNAPTFNWWSLY